MDINDSTTPPPSRPDITLLRNANATNPGVLCFNATMCNEIVAWIDYLEKVLARVVERPCHLHDAFGEAGLPHYYYDGHQQTLTFCRPDRRP